MQVRSGECGARLRRVQGRQAGLHLRRYSTVRDQSIRLQLSFLWNERDETFVETELQMSTTPRRCRSLRRGSLRAASGWRPSSTGSSAGTAGCRASDGCNLVEINEEECHPVLLSDHVIASPEITNSRLYLLYIHPAKRLRVAAAANRCICMNVRVCWCID